MLMKVGQIVKSTSGRDQGRFYVILSEENGWFYLADGKLHKQAAPKKKNPKHLAPTARMVAVDQMTTDKALRKMLAAYQNGAETPNSWEGGEQHV